MVLNHHRIQPLPAGPDPPANEPAYLLSDEELKDMEPVGVPLPPDSTQEMSKTMAMDTPMSQ